jgi:hypothetical protein
MVSTAGVAPAPADGGSAPLPLEAIVLSLLSIGACEAAAAHA